MELFDLVADPDFHEQPIERKRAGFGSFLWRVLNYIVNSLLRLTVFIVHLLLQRPLTTSLTALCLWSGAQVGLNMMTQGKPHPAPLFQKQELAAAKTMQPLPAKMFQASYEQQEDVGDIRDAQTKLAALGIYKGALDGRMGPKTAEAIRNFQQRAKLEVTGAVDARLMARLQDGDQAAVSEADSILIFTVQHRLNELGYNAGDEDGRLSPKTQEAIRAFETAHGLPVTGAIRGLLLSSLTSAKLASNQ